MAKSDEILIKRLMKSFEKSRGRFSQLEQEISDTLSVLFRMYVGARSKKINSAMMSLKLDEAGRIASSRTNLLVLRKLMADLGVLTAQYYSYNPKSPGRVVDYMSKNLVVAGKRGVQQYDSSAKIAEKVVLPPEAYKNQELDSLIKRNGRNTFRKMFQRETANLDTIRNVFLDNMHDPTGTPDSLRWDIEGTGLLDGMIDTAGRHITSEERADRIAKYEFSKMQREAYDMTIDKYGGLEDELFPTQRYYLWDAVMDGRTAEEHASRHGFVLTDEGWDNVYWGDGQFGRPPLRPRCRCDAIFVKPSWFSKNARRAFKPMTAGKTYTPMKMSDFMQVRPGQADRSVYKLDRKQVRPIPAAMPERKKYAQINT